MKGLTTQNEIKMLQGLGVDLSNVIVRRDEASCKWFIEIHVCILTRKSKFISSKESEVEDGYLHT